MKAIKRYLNIVKNIVTGRTEISQQTKLEVVSLGIMAVHFVMILMFIGFDIGPMILYNVLVVAYYIYVFRRVRDGEVLKGYLMTFAEIAIQVVFGTFMLGWNVGFHMYILAIIPLFYYLNLAYDPEGRRLYQPMLGALAAVAVFVASFEISIHFTPRYLLSDGQISGLFLYNALLAIFMLTSMSHLFILERRNEAEVLTQQNQELDVVASEDPLTKLQNRRSMEKRLAAAMAAAKEKGTIYSIVMGDIDFFKKINDTYGHDCGDEALKAVAEIFRASVRDGDSIARWGGEEFLILIIGNREEAVMVAERIRKRIEEKTISYEGTEVRFTMTFGVTTYKPGYSIETLIQQADDNLYNGKRSGRNRVVAREF